MKIILSRKGFDSKYGGCASPIFPDGRMLSLPIPVKKSNLCFGDIRYGNGGVGDLVGKLTKGRIGSDAYAHFDPDLDMFSLPNRKNGWHPTLGQVGAANSHLFKSGITTGDLFLFFGWFRNLDANFQWRGDDLHAIFGWIQIGDVIRVGKEVEATKELYPWLSDNPHVHGVWGGNNTIYVAAERLNIPGLPDLNHLPGGGRFSCFDQARVLTRCGRSRSIWRLPRDFSPQGGKGFSLSYHKESSQWVDDGDPHYISLHSARIGQEFVLGGDDRDSINNWILDIFESELKK